jgi:hypothetical protein
MPYLKTFTASQASHTLQSRNAERSYTVSKETTSLSHNVTLQVDSGERSVSEFSIPPNIDWTILYLQFLWADRFPVYDMHNIMCNHAHIHHTP